jgi:hypothetical protein
MRIRIRIRIWVSYLSIGCGSASYYSLFSDLDPLMLENDLLRNEQEVEQGETIRAAFTGYSLDV